MERHRYTPSSPSRTRTFLPYVHRLRFCDVSSAIDLADQVRSRKRTQLMARFLRRCRYTEDGGEAFPFFGMTVSERKRERERARERERERRNHKILREKYRSSPIKMNSTHQSFSSMRNYASSFYDGSSFIRKLQYCRGESCYYLLNTKSFDFLEGVSLKYFFLMYNSIILSER